MINITKAFLFATAIMLFACKSVHIDNPEVTIPELQEHINYLASDELKGRLPGTEGDQKSAEYIRDMLSSFGLSPAVDNGLQSFEITASIEAGEDNKMLIDGDPVSGDQFMPMAFSENISFTGSVVFAGYGFSIMSDSLEWNDYADTDLEGSWVMILRGDPEIDDPSSMFARVSADRDKVMLAKDNGAGGVLMVSGKDFDAPDELEPLTGGEYPTGIPVFRIKRETANKILELEGKNITELEQELNETYEPVSFEIHCSIEGTADLNEQKVTTHNVLMTLQGNDPILEGEYIIIGAHFDHLGMGGPGTSSRAVDITGVHYGADDNASGIAAMIEIAERFAAMNDNKRSIIFAGFAAEEMGLLGSKYLSTHMPVEAEKINAMINLDMIGRLKENKILQITGVGTAEEMESIITSHSDTTVLKLTLSQEGYGPSDHSSFYGMDIPVLSFTTGAHLDYHTPYDSPDKIKYEGLADISALVYDISKELANNKKLAFKEAGPKTPANRAMRRKGVTLGIMPDFAGNVKNGLRADFVTPGRPADLGGMEKGDIIVAINGKEINNIEDYMYRLSQYERGETIQVEVLRDDKKELLLIAL
ncbi:MAG: M20/M25/M40 family metallo-hydrolase [Bacteroidales bacterium]|nr:M20/M25/M40 family metallo-hydrolase [Bacteroidales bacterium]